MNIIYLNKINNNCFYYFKKCYIFFGNFEYLFVNNNYIYIILFIWLNKFIKYESYLIKDAKLFIFSRIS